jgi:hypothetical protein
MKQSSRCFLTIIFSGRGLQIGYGADMGKSVSVCIRTRTDMGTDTDLVIRGSVGIRSTDTNQEISQNG